MPEQGQILDRLRDLMLSDAGPNGQLPTERETCQRLGVSRTQLREHLQVLEMVGLLRRDQGRGTFLQSPDGVALGSIFELAMMAEHVSQSDLLGVRRVLERESVRLASAGLDPETEGRLVQACGVMRESASPQEVARADHEFHMLLFRASGNGALKLLGAALSEALRRPMDQMRIHLADAPGQLEMARVHDRVLRSVQKRDAAAAIRAMDRHFDLTERIAGRVWRDQARRQT